MPMKFYTAPNSTATVTAAVLAELDHNQASPLAEHITISMGPEGTRSADYLTNVNPNGLVPTIVHDGVSIWESAAITMYLGEMFGEARGLYPALGPARGEAMKWIIWTNTVFIDAARRLIYTMRKAAAAPDQSDAEKSLQAATADQARADIAKNLEILNKALASQEYLLREGYSLADTHLWSAVAFTVHLGVTLDAYANVKAWNEKIVARPALAKLD